MNLPGFQKITSSSETRYVLESASVGGTSSGAVASVSSPLGKVRKRGNILAQETDKDPCWKDYKQLGTKKKKGKTVPNCVPKNEDHTGFDSAWGSNSYATYANSSHGHGVAESASNMCRVCGQTPCNCTGIYESSPPGFPEELMMKLKKQYKGNPERAFATAWAIHKKNKKTVKEDSLENLQQEFDFVYHPKRRQLYVYPKGADTSDIYSNAIAWISLDYAGTSPDGEKQYSSSDTMVQKPYQRRGIATAMYQYLRQQGVPIVSSDEQTSQGAAMWKGFRNKGLANNNKFLEDPYFEELENALEAKLKPTDTVDVWKQDFQKADPEQYHQFRNKTAGKKDQMAIAAHYASRHPNLGKK